MKIALDVDDVLCAFTPHAHTFHGKELSKCDYWCEKTMHEKLGAGWFVKHIAPIKEFWRTLPRLSDPKDIDFEVAYYISSFPEEMYDIRVQWLKENGFPDAPLVCSMNKVKTCKDLEVTVLVDDKPATIKALQGTSTKGIHFITPYAGFEPIGDYITNLNQVRKRLGRKIVWGTDLYKGCKI